MQSLMNLAIHSLTAHLITNFSAKFNVRISKLVERFLTEYNVQPCFMAHVTPHWVSEQFGERTVNNCSRVSGCVLL